MAKCKKTKADTWITRVPINGTIDNVIETLMSLKAEYPDKKYELSYDLNNEVWLRDMELLGRIEAKEMTKRKKDIIKQEKRLMRQLKRKYEE